MSSLIQELENFGGGVFVTHRGIDSRVTEAEIWRAFEEPVVVWIHGDSFDDSILDRLVKVARNFPQIRRFRFTGTRVTPQAVKKLYEFWSGIPIDGVAA